MNRRFLQFGDLSQVMLDVLRLAPDHRTVGRWSLGQICLHLANSFNGSIDGFDLSRHRVKRALFRRGLLWYTFRWGIPENYLVDPQLAPPPEVKVQEGVVALSKAIERYQNHHGSLQAHPLFGRMPREVWDRMHCVHCAHHLSFGVPAGVDDNRS
jgi:hypothetical protein